MTIASASTRGATRARRSPTPASPSKRAASALAERAAQHTLAVNPLIGIRRKEVLKAATTRLILAATAPGALMVPGKLSVLVRMMTPRRYVDPAHSHRVAGQIYGGAFRRDPQLVARTFRCIRFSSTGGYFLQLAAALGWTSLPWLPLLRQPTLVMAGADDPIVPTINARIMQWLIRDARLVIVDCGHLFLVSRPAECARIVDGFLTKPDAVRQAA